MEEIRYHHHFGVCKTLVVAAAAAVYQETLCISVWPKKFSRLNPLQCMI